MLHFLHFLGNMFLHFGNSGFPGGAFWKRIFYAFFCNSFGLTTAQPATADHNSKGTNYPWGEVVQRVALTAAKSGTQVVVEVPPEAQIAESKQYVSLSKGEAWRHVVLDGCSHDQRLVGKDHQGQSCIKYCHKEWEFFTANTSLEPKPSDRCKSKHKHAEEHDFNDPGNREVRTSQVSKRLLKSLTFEAGDGKLVSMPAKGPKKLDGVVVEFRLNKEVTNKGSDHRARVVLDGPIKSATQEDELVKKINRLRGNKVQSPVLFTVSLRRSGGGSVLKGSTDAQGDGSPRGYKTCRGVLKSLKRLLKKFAESPHVYFSLDMPSTFDVFMLVMA